MDSITGRMIAKVIKFQQWQWVATPPTTVTYGEWSHWLLTWSESTGVLLYHNGKGPFSYNRFSLKMNCVMDYEKVPLTPELIFIWPHSRTVYSKFSRVDP